MKLNLRQHITKIVPLTDKVFDFVCSHFSESDFLKYQYLVQASDHIQNDFYIGSGLVKASRSDEDGKEHILQFGMENTWITDPQAYHGQIEASLNVQCLEDSKTFFINYQDREKLCADLPKIEKFFTKKAISEQITLQRRILCLISNNAQARYKDFLRQYPGLIQRIPKTMIASYLGVSRETLSRLTLA